MLGFFYQRLLISIKTNLKDPKQAQCSEKFNDWIFKSIALVLGLSNLF